MDGALRDLFDGRTYEWEVETRERKAHVRLGANRRATEEQAQKGETT